MALLWAVSATAAAAEERPLVTDLPAVSGEPAEPAVFPEILEPATELPLHDPEGWVEEEDGSMLLETGPQGAYRVPMDCDPWANDQLRWIDRTHHAFSRGLCWPTQWLDAVFGDADDQTREVAGTSVRIVGAQLLQDNGEHDSDVRFRVRVHLPGIEHRLSLIFASEQDFEDKNAGLQGAPEMTGEASNAARAGVRWVLRTADNMDIDMDVGVRSQLKLYWRARYRQQYALTEYWSARFEESVDWRDPKGFRSRTILNFDRPLSRHRFFRLTSFAEISEENIDEGLGWHLQQSAALGVELTKRQALRYLISVDGYTRPTTRAENYRAAVTYRHNIWRPWFFYEVEPYLLWAREHGFNTMPGIVLRVETLFGLR
ncbi:hypothetical protein [Alcanivorax quisquiliarum]|uniref:Uncharacterized protein n=1 Tax=Alcanivorax quisquiliarum TaxID=2933565 RepID=A0ABT0E457_9GAMM|nr:hypothetical protein [Alcanivorax quisquiliarum]MCK0536600.1 hypothetical protein [Alcanivorax quisquiliarum]